MARKFLQTSFALTLIGISFFSFSAKSMDDSNIISSNIVKNKSVYIDDSINFNTIVNSTVSNLTINNTLVNKYVEEAEILRLELDFARKTAIVGQANLRHCWHKPQDSECIDYTDIDEGIKATGWTQYSRSDIINHLNRHPHFNYQPYPYLRILHNFRN